MYLYQNKWLFFEYHLSHSSVERNCTWFFTVHKFNQKNSRNRSITAIRSRCKFYKTISIVVRALLLALRKVWKFTGESPCDVIVGRETLLAEQFCESCENSLPLVTRRGALWRLDREKKSRGPTSILPPDERVPLEGC